MYNYGNLDDSEFELLCRDIMEKKLDTELRAFGPGRDGGVDLTDNVDSHNIVVQVKNYKSSPFSALKSSLTKEIEKVERLKPHHYYVCCSKELTDPNVRVIYSMFSKYMESDRNIITLKEIDEFLKDPKNIEIVRRHFKLWLCSTDILSEIYNQNIFIDCEALLSDIMQEAEYFVSTKIYDKCIKVLESQQALILIGPPGVGKTATSKMLALYFADKGYRIRHTTNGSIADIKNAVSSDKACKELILLDDCLGQCYFNLGETQENELLSLIKFIKLYPEKIIILNSRVTIFNEARERSQELYSFIEKNRSKIHIIDMNLISLEEKARMFYNFLKMNSIPEEYYKKIIKNRNYRKIVKHRNYNPRIIEYVTSPSHYRFVSSEDYFDFIIKNLDNPSDVWKNEFERRLSSIDRILMNVLFSLTETTVQYDILEECFNSRLMKEDNIDTTVSNFEDTISRLNGSLIKLVDEKGSRTVGVLNPSINDYLQSKFFKNTMELEKIRKSTIYFTQLERCYNDNERELALKEKLKSETIFSLKSVNDSEKISALALFIDSKYKVFSSICKTNLLIYLRDVNCYNHFGEINFRKYDILKEIFEEPLLSYYDIPSLILKNQYIDVLLNNLDLEELIYIVNKVSGILKGYDECSEDHIEFIDESLEHLNCAIAEYIDEFDLQELCDSIDIQEIFSQKIKEIKKRDYYDPEESDHYYDEVLDSIVIVVKELLASEIESSLEWTLQLLNPKYWNYEKDLNIPDISYVIDGTEITDIVRSFIEPDYDDYDDDLKYEDYSDYSVNDFDEVDMVFS